MCNFVKTYVFVFVLALTCRQANAQIVLDFTRTGSGGVHVSGTGSGNTTATISSNTWQILDFDNDFLSDSIGHFNPIAADTVTGLLTNSLGVSRQITEFNLNRSAASNDDASFKTKSNIHFSLSQPYTFTIDATFDSATLSYASLIPGTYTDNTVSGGSEIFGTTTINVAAVPEPPSLEVFAAGIAVFAFVVIRKRKTRNARRRKAKATIGN